MNNIEIMISLVSLVISFINVGFSISFKIKSDKENKIYLEQKEKIHEIERKNDELYDELNSRSNLIPYFQLVVNESNYKGVVNEEGKIILKMQLINIGLHSATNIKIINNGSVTEMKFVETSGSSPIEFGIHDYLDEYYALPEGTINFSIQSRPLESKNSNIIVNIRFKIEFEDVIGNLYEQEFSFPYDNFIVNGIGRNYFSKKPKLIKKAIEDDSKLK